MVDAKSTEGGSVDVTEISDATADAPACPVLVRLSAAGGVAMFLSPDQVTFRTPAGWVALAFAIAPAIALLPVAAQWLRCRILRRFRKI